MKPEQYVIASTELDLILKLKGFEHKLAVKTLVTYDLQYITANVLQVVSPNNPNSDDIVDVLNKKFTEKITAVQRVALLNQYLLWCVAVDKEPSPQIAFWSAPLSTVQKTEVFKHLGTLYKQHSLKTTTGLLILTKASPFNLIDTPNLISTLNLDKIYVEQVLNQNPNIKTQLIQCAKKEENSAYLYNLTNDVEEILYNKLKDQIENLSFSKLWQTFEALDTEKLSNAAVYLKKLINVDDLINKFHECLKQVPRILEDKDNWKGFECMAYLANLGILTENELERAFTFTQFINEKNIISHNQGLPIKLSAPTRLIKYISEKEHNRSKIVLTLLKSLVHTFSKSSSSFVFYNKLNETHFVETDKDTVTWIRFLSIMSNSRLRIPITNIEESLKQTALDKTITQITDKTTTLHDIITELGITNTIYAIHTVLALAKENVNMHDVLKQLIQSQQPINNMTYPLPELNI